MFDRCHIVSPGDLREASAKLATITDPITAPKTALAGAPDLAKSANGRLGELQKHSGKPRIPHVPLGASPSQNPVARKGRVGSSPTPGTSNPRWRLCRDAGAVVSARGVRVDSRVVGASWALSRWE